LTIGIQRNEFMSDPGAGNARRRLRLTTAIFAGSVLLATAGWYFWPSPAAPTPPEVSFEGVEDRVVAAIRAATESVQSDSGSAEAWGQLGHVLRAHRFDVESDVCYAQAEQLDDQDPRWPYLQGDRLSLSDPAAALLMFERAVRLSTHSGTWRSATVLRLAETLLQLNRLDEAEPLLVDVTVSDPGNARGHWDLGLLRRAQNRLDESVTHLLLAAESPFTRKMACAQLAGVYGRLGNATATRQFARRAEQAPPDILWVDPLISEYLSFEVKLESQYARVGRLEAQGRFREAAQLLSQEVQRAPSARSFLAYGIILARLGRHDQAEQMLMAAASEDPGKVQAHYFLAVIAYFQGEKLQSQAMDYKQKFEQAISRAQRAIDLKPDHGLAHLYRGLALKGLSRSEEALDELVVAVQCRPDFSQTHLELGQALVDAGRVDEGMVELDFAVRLSSGIQAQTARRALEDAKKKADPESTSP
jgi:tetratricopeptide (TPR) repeat protein